MDWQQLFGFATNPFELVLRGTATYWFLFLIFRFLMRRDVGAVGIADVLLLVLVADAAQPAMTGDYESVTEGAIVVGTIVGWNWVLDALSYHYRWIARIVVPRPMVLIRHGEFIERNMRSEHLTTDEVLTRLRQNGVDKVGDVRIARLEPDGEISVFKYDAAESGKRRDRNAPI